MDDSVLVVYVEPLLVDRSVLFIGDARGEALTRVASVADGVFALDTSPNARPRRLPNGSVEPFDPYDLERVDGPFDVVVVADVASLGRRPGDRLDEIARIIGNDGHVVVGLDADDPVVDHEQLWDALAIRFDVVRMAGSVPMNAYAVAELGSGDGGGVTVDGSLLSRRPKTRWFIGVAGQTDPPVDGYVLVQVDESAPAKVAPRAPAVDVDKLSNEVASLRNVVNAARAEVEKLKAERDAIREDRKRVERDAKEAETLHRRAIAALEDAMKTRPSVDELRKLEERLLAQAERTQELEAEVDRRGRLVRELVEETRERGVVSSSFPSESADVESALERAVRAEAERAEALFLVDELRARLAEARGQRGPLTMDERDLSAQVGQLSAQLMLSRERELESRGARDIARGENLALVAQVAALETQNREMRERVSAQLDSFSGASSSGSLDGAVDSIGERLESLRGECTGLRFRLDSIERGHVLPTISTDDSARAAELARHAEALRLENEALAADLAESKSALRRASDTSAATRDALVERLQLELADQERRGRELEERERALSLEVRRLREAVVEASVSVEATDVMTRRVQELERDLRDAIGAAEKAANDAREQTAFAASESSRHAAALESERRRTASAESSLAETRRALEETRALLEELRATTDSGASAPRRRSADFEGEPVDSSSRGSDEERDLLVRSLTSQLEERDDRIRALERRLAGGASEPDDDVETMRRELHDLRERTARLTDEIRVEREARRAAEERGQGGIGTAAAMASRELERTVEQKSRALEAAEARSEGYERDIRTLREVFAETRQGLEHLLGAASGGGDPELATRLGELLTVLGRY